MIETSPMSKAQVLIVDDETDILDLVSITYGRMGIRTRKAATLAEAYRLLESHRFDFCLTDMRLPDGDGTDLVRYIAEHHPDTPVAMITAYGDIDSAVAAMKAGAFDFVAKPLDLRILRDLIHAGLRLQGPPAISPEEEAPESKLLGKSPQMTVLRAMIQKLARNQAPVFISGESGTGKELVARLIHEQGPRAESAFVPVNCGAIPAELMESELFGHRRGSFTGAVADKAGLFQAAAGGTLFLDEIADMPLPMQVKLLRAIQQKSIRPVGAEQEIPVDARVISASHRNLALEVERGNFRQDLFYRIHVIDLEIPPLRERPEDIMVLAEHILGRIAESTGSAPARLSEEAAQMLVGFPFPGNVRELENVLERATALCDHRLLRPEDLHLSHLEPKDANIDVEEPAADDAVPLEDKLGDVERQAILKALDETRWNRTAAAKRLGMSPRSLRYRMSKLGL
jgi:two-component system response regulator PilR (NtrC family)